MHARTIDVTMACQSEDGRAERMRRFCAWQRPLRLCLVLSAVDSLCIANARPFPMRNLLFDTSRVSRGFLALVGTNEIVLEQSFCIVHDSHHQTAVV